MVDHTAHRKSRLPSPCTIPAPIGSSIDHRPNISIISPILKNLSVAVRTMVATNTNSQRTTINGITPTVAQPTYKVTILIIATTKIVATSSNMNSILPTIPTMPLGTLNNLISGTTLLHRQLVVFLPYATTIFPTLPSMPRPPKNSADKRNTAAKNMPTPNRILTELFRPLQRISTQPMPRAITGLPLECGLPPRPQLPPQDHPTKKTLIFSTAVF
mmetsp:Transcript_31031/g.90773  ORF Transcript_31031/g.90773 Transcript_31031/m.90773 type:complete len:216 (+) Transcript_31031:765-1412(+)